MAITLLVCFETGHEGIVVAFFALHHLWHLGDTVGWQVLLLGDIKLSVGPVTWFHRNGRGGPWINKDGGMGVVVALRHGCSKMADLCYRRSLWWDMGVSLSVSHSLALCLSLWLPVPNAWRWYLCLCGTLSDWLMVRFEKWPLSLSMLHGYRRTSYDFVWALKRPCSGLFQCFKTASFFPSILEVITYM
jgi:hypothetical protein